MMKKKFTTIVLALLMTMMFATAGVAALPAAPEDNADENSNYWEVTVDENDVTDTSAVIVWNPAEDEKYEHSDEAVFNITYKNTDNGEEKTVENIMSENAAAEIKSSEAVEDKDLQVYVFNDDEAAEDAEGNKVPLGYSYTLKELDPEASYEVIVEKTDDNSTSDAVEFSTEPAKDPEETKDTTEAAKDKDAAAGTDKSGNSEEAKGKKDTAADTKPNANKKTNGTYKSENAKQTEKKTNDVDASKLKSGDKSLNTAAAGSYVLKTGWTTSTSLTTARFTWKMNRSLSKGDRIDINGYKTTPKNNGNGTYSVSLKDFDPLTQYRIPIKVIDQNGKTVSNVIYHYRMPYYQLKTGWTTSTSSTTANFTWKMNRPLDKGHRIDINGYKTTPKNNGNGTYTIGLKDFDPVTQYSIPIKVIDQNGKTVSNVIYHYRMPYYQLTTGWTTSTSLTTANFTWKMNRPLDKGDRIDINGYKTTPKNNGNGTYTIGLKDFDPLVQYSIPIKVINRNGKTISNVIYHYRMPYYQLSAGKTKSLQGEIATLNWKSNRKLGKGHTFYVNNRKVNPTRNSDGTYTVKVSGIKEGMSYSLPVKIVDSKGKTVSNTIYITVEAPGSEIRSMQLQITFGETVALTDHSDGTTTTTFYKGFTTVTDGNDGGPDEGRYHFWYKGKLYYVKWSRISSVSIASSGFDKTYSAATAQSYVNRLNISSSTGILIWVNTYTQKEYIFTGSTNNWRLAYGPWQVTTGSPYTPTQTGLGYIHQKDPYFHNLPYWSTVTTYSFHGKLSSWGLGYPESNGCVRNTNDHAEYIYYNCPVGTTVYVY